MKISAIETIRIDEFPNLLWVHVCTDDGIVGLGETFYGPGAAEAHIHETIAPILLDQDPLLISKHHSKLIGYVGFSGASAEQRGRSAIDVALWDIWGQATNQPIHQLLGGAVRDDIRVYNTCAGYRYVRKSSGQSTNNFGLDTSEGPFEDLDAFLNNADDLANSLLEMGIDGMKIWPFDYAAELSKGHHISSADMKTALKPFEKIRKSVGDKMDVMAELHALWDRPNAVKIARELEQFSPYWVEDPVFMDHLGSLDSVARSTSCPIAVGETRGGIADYRYLLELDSLSLIIMDIAWCGGLTEAKKVAAMAEAWHVPVAFHDCTGPVALTASTHLAMASKNCEIQEIVRAFYFGWYTELMTSLPPINNGRISAPNAAGLGTALQPETLNRKDCHIRRTLRS